MKLAHIHLGETQDITTGFPFLLRGVTTSGCTDKVIDSESHYAKDQPRISQGSTKVLSKSSQHS